MNFMRFLRICVALGGALCAGALAPSASAQTVEAGGQSCKFSGYTYEASISAPKFVFSTYECTPLNTGNVTTVSIGSASGSLIATAPTDVVIPVNCTGPDCTGITVTAAVAQPATLVTISANSVTDGRGSIKVSGAGTTAAPLAVGTTADITLGVTPVTGTPVVQKSGATFVNPYRINIVAAGSGPPPGCSTTKSYDPGPTGLQAVPLLANLETASIKFSPVRGTRIPPANSGSFGLLRAGVYGLNPPAGVQYQISECPGDFTPNTLTPPERCGGYFASSSNASVNVSAAAVTNIYVCKLDPLKTYYLNIRFVNPATGVSTCPATKTCGINVNLYW